MPPTSSAPTVTDPFWGDNAHLADCINALVAISDRGSLSDGPLGGHARTLLVAAAARLVQAAPAAPAEPGNWSVYNTAIEHASGLSYAEAMEWLSDDRLERGWSAVCVVDKDNRPTPPSSGLDETADARDAARYRALRESCKPGSVMPWEMPTIHPPFHPEQRYLPEGLDAAIDAARALSGGEGV